MIPQISKLIPTALLLTVTLNASAQSLHSLPGKIQIYGSRGEARFRILAHTKSGDKDVTGQCRITTSGPVRLNRAGVILPTNIGKAAVTAVMGTERINIPVTISGASGPGAPFDAPVGFLTEVEPILTRYGCNAGACHGSQFGKGGFKLSLAGYDPELDHNSLVRAAGGRRVLLTDPPRSLLLRKPALELAHQGGLKLARGTRDYQTVLRWIAEGACGPESNVPEVIALKSLPERANLPPGSSSGLIVMASFSDGTVRDVTHHTRINTLNDSVTSVTSDGLATAAGRGEGHVMLRYGGRAALASFVTPYAITTKPITGFDGPIDRRIAAKWRSVGLVPAPDSDDSTFLRRVMLDIIGTLPTPKEAREFAADRDRAKRVRLIDSLLERPEYVDLWTQRWSDLLRSSKAGMGARPQSTFNTWLRDGFAQNRRFDEVVYDLLTSGGYGNDNGPANYYRVVTSPQDLTETTAQLFLGVRLQCAKCHHHPFEKWSQQDYYRFAACFARTQTRIAGPDSFVQGSGMGEVKHPKTNLVMTAKPLDIDDGPFAAVLEGKGDRRDGLAAWITSPKNRLFAKVIVNRYWAWFFGRGIIHPVDDVRVTNPASHPELLEELAADFISSGYDVKRLIRRICASRVYGLDSRSIHPAAGDEAFFNRFAVRRMSAEVLMDAVGAAAGSREKFFGVPAGTRAVELPDSGIASAFLDTFGRPARTTACECERAGEPNLGQALQMVNGETVNRLIADSQGRAAKLAATKTSDSEVIREVFLATLSREPSGPETASSLRAFAKASDRRKAIEDLLWVIVNMAEFSCIR